MPSPRNAAPKLCGAQDSGRWHVQTAGDDRDPSRCDFHGWKSPTGPSRCPHVAQEERHVGLSSERLGEPTPLGHPVEELLAFVAEAKSWLGVLRERLAELSDFESFDRTGAESERAVVALYETSLDSTAAVPRARLARPRHPRRRAGGDRVRLVLDLVLRVLESHDLDLDPCQIGTARTLVATELRTLTTEAAV